MKNLNRRSLLTGAAFAAGALALGACSADQLANAEAQWASIVGKIQSAVAVAVKYIPTVESIAATAASLFGPGYAALVQIGTTAFNQVVATLTNVVNNLTPPASARLSVKLGASSPLAPVAIGTTANGVAVLGWKAS